MDKLAVLVVGLNSEPQNIEYRISKDGIARAAQALAPRVAKSCLKQTECIHSTFDVGRSSVSFSIKLVVCLSGDWPDCRLRTFFHHSIPYSSPIYSLYFIIQHPHLKGIKWLSIWFFEIKFSFLSFGMWFAFTDCYLISFLDLSRSRIEYKETKASLTKGGMWWGQKKKAKSLK